MAELSVIIPFVNEYPQVLFTIQSIAQELRGRVDFEIIVINNYCEEVKRSGIAEDNGYNAVLASEKLNSWLKVLHYKDKLSHWNAKNLGVENSSGEFLWFCDAHCIISRDSLYNMFAYYRDTYGEINGTLHLPLTYKLLESRRLIYKLVYNKEAGEVHYSFTPYGADRTEVDKFYYRTVPCMSTCGMMITRQLYEDLGGWPKELGIYGGGENFLNFSLAVIGKTVNVFHADPLFHHGEARGYSYTYDDYSRNRILATYLFGGKNLATTYSLNRKGDKGVLKSILEDVLVTCKEHRELIKKQQITDIRDWISTRI